MGTSSLADTLAASGLLAAGLKAHMDKLRRRGLDEAFAESIQSLTKSIGDLNAEQEALKSRLKEKTTLIDETVASLKAKTAEARKVVKLELAQPSWKEFGISDAK